eukprot:COSAG02_NODE_5894_length_3956_cov_4.285196_7_plen_44_part_00
MAAVRVQQLLKSDRTNERVSDTGSSAVLQTRTEMLFQCLYADP